MLQALARALNAADPEAPVDEHVEAQANERWRTLTDSALQVDHHLAASPEAVWAALATPDGLHSWWWRHWEDVVLAELASVLTGSGR